MTYTTQTRRLVTAASVLALTTVLAVTVHAPPTPDDTSSHVEELRESVRDAGEVPTSPPASLRIHAEPQDALITIDGRHESIGTLHTDELNEDTFDVRVERPGFEPVTTRLDVEPGSSHTEKFTLEPRTFTVALDADPDADIELRRHGDIVASGQTPFSTEIPAGELTLAVQREGYGTAATTFFLDSDIDEMVFLDRPGQLVRRAGQFRSGGSPKASLFSPDGDEIWVARLLDEEAGVKVLDTATGESVASIDLDGAGAVELAMTRDGDRVYASQMETARVFEIDADNKEVTRTFDTKSSWTKVLALAHDESFILASNWVGNDISIIDLDTGELDHNVPTIETPRGLHLTPGDQILYVAGFEHGELQRIDLTTGDSEVVFDRGGSLRHIAADDWSGRMFISDLRYNLIWEMDMDTEEVSVFTRTDFSPNTIALGPHGDVLFVSCRGRTHPSGNYYKPGHEWGSVLLYDTSDATLLDAVVGGNQPTGLDITPDGHKMVFSNFLDSDVELFQVPSSEKLRDGGGGRSDVYRRELAKH